MTKSVWTVLLIILGFSALAAEVGRPRVTDDSISPGYLVAAEIVRVETEKSWQATLKVTHVYKGPDSLRGREVELDANMVFTRGQSKYAGFAPGQKGIWSVYENAKNGSSLCAAMGVEFSRLLRIPVSVRDCGIDARWYPTGVLWVEAVERVWKAPQGERFGVLEGMIFDKTPEISAWALFVAAQTKSPEADKLLHELLQKHDLPVLTRLILDQCLVSSDKEGWSSSQERIAILESLCKEKMSQTEGWHVAAFLQNERTDADLRLSLAKVVVDNEAAPVEVRSFLAGHVVRIFKAARVRNDEAAFNYLTGLLATGKDASVRVSAARGMAEIPLDDAMKARVKELIEQEKSPYVLKQLKALFAPNQGLSHPPK